MGSGIPGALGLWSVLQAGVSAAKSGEQCDHGVAKHNATHVAFLRLHYRDLHQHSAQAFKVVTTVRLNLSWVWVL